MTAPSAEESVIGSLLIDDRCAGEIMARLRPEDFRDNIMRRLYEAARSLYLEQLPIDPVTVASRAGGDELLPAVRRCMDETPTAANAVRYCEIVRDQTALSKLRGAALDLADAGSLEEARDILARASGILTDRPGVRTVSLAEMMADFLRRMGQPKPDYLRWGLGILDDMLHTGPGSYVLIAARPSTGKTALALQLGLSIARTKRVGFYSLETVPEVAADRIAAAQLGMSLPDIKNRRASPSDLQALAYRMNNSETLRGSFDFISASSMTVADIRAQALASRHEVVMIDYVQLIRPDIRGERTEQMQRVSMELRAMAQMTGIVVVGLAQLRRPDTQQKQKAPTMADLKESGQFEQDADSILLMYLTDPGNRRSDRRILVEKNKEGYAGFYARFRFDGTSQTFTCVDDEGKPLEPKRATFEELDKQMEMEELPEEW